MPIDFAYEADSKTYPKRLLIALGAAFSGLILGSLFLLLYQYIQVFKEAENKG
jgi:uncharacterized protein involved in exopolysaccharide biosynthesis